MKNTKAYKIARAYDKFMERYFYVEWASAQGNYTTDDIVNNITTDTNYEVGCLQEMLTCFDDDEPGYKDCIELINNIKTLTL